jgi:hypothetical protein
MTQGKTAIVLLLCAGAASVLEAASPFVKLAGDALLHKASQVVLPARIAMFEREGTRIYGSAGKDISAEYDLDMLIRGDVYVYPVGAYGKDFKSEVSIQQEAIRKLNKSVKLISQTSFQLRQDGKPIPGLRAEYQLTRALFNSQSRRCGSQFYLFQIGNWFIAYRFSYPIEKSAAANQHIRNFLSQWRWRQSWRPGGDRARPSEGDLKKVQRVVGQLMRTHFA